MTSKDEILLVLRKYSPPLTEADVQKIADQIDQIVARLTAKSE
jgi:hypothetical protein